MALRPNGSRQTRALLQALLDNASEWHYGYDLSRRTGLKSGTLYPILVRLEAQGWLDARWAEDPAPGKPRRHLYRLTARGCEQAEELLAEHPSGLPSPRAVPSSEGATP
jgi:DNA-binding PadR family transcriptional regulator